MKTIDSFTVDHDKIKPGMYISRVDGDVTTFDLRTRVPNAGDYMDNRTMHSVEHMLATFLRNGEIGPHVLYFGPMGCQTGFYLLTRSLSPQEVKKALVAAILSVLSYEGPVFGASRKECGQYQNLSLADAQKECRAYLPYLLEREGFSYDA